jgi:hypothetical protein
VSVCFPDESRLPAAGEYSNDPGTLAVASSCFEPSLVPLSIAPGVAQAIVGVALFTVSVTLEVTVLYSAVLVGVKVTDRVCDPACGIVPETGE